MFLLVAALLTGDVCRDGAEAARRRDFASAEPLLNRCLESTRAPLEAYLVLCGVYQAQKKSDALAQTALAAIGRFPDEKRFYLTVATVAGREKRYRQAIDALEPAAKRWPRSA